MQINFLVSKFILSLIIGLLSTVCLFAQAPSKLSYQAIVRDGNGDLVVNAQVGMRISILQGSDNGIAIYEEILTPTTNANGLISIEIGSEPEFSEIDWSAGPYFVKTETDPSGGNLYSSMGVSQLLSVPYALYATTAENLPPGNFPGEMMYWNGTQWIGIATGNDGDVLTLVGNVPTWVGEAGGPVDDVPTVTNPITGEVWMDRNLGASRVATSMTDDEAYGDLYQWGRGADGHQLRTSGTTTTLSDSDTPDHGDFIINADSPFDWRVPQNDNLWDGVNGVNNPCPQGFRLPTEAEWEAERMTWSSNDAEGAFNSVLKLPVAGQRRYSNGEFQSTGASGGYWSSTLSNEAGGIYSRFMNFRYNAYVISSHRATGNSVRCIRN